MSEVINMHVQETIQTGGGVTPTGQISIVENGIVNVAQYATANVQVPQGITPTGTINISQNGDTDVTNYAMAHVSVSPSAEELDVYVNNTVLGGAD